jgi:hypothetical protein
MSASIENQTVTLNKLRRQLADAEATVSALKLKIAKAEAKLTGEPVPVSGLEMLWHAALPIARNRSSKQQCRIDWNKIPKGDRPTIETLVNALKIWNRSDEWRKDGHSFVPGLHRWIARRCWEDLPEVEAARSRTPKARTLDISTPLPDAATPEEIAEILGALKPKRMNS